MILRIVSGTTTIVLSEQGSRIFDWSHAVHPIDPTQTVEETLLLFSLGTNAAFMNKVTAIQSVGGLIRADAYSIIAKPAYLEIDMNGNGNWYRSLIKNLRVEYDPDTFMTGMVTSRLKATIYINRVSSWERKTALPITLQNRNGIGTNVTIRNSTVTATSGQDNYVYIPDGALLGSLPVIPDIYINNNFNDSDRLGEVYMGATRWAANPFGTEGAGTYSGMYEAENGTLGSGSTLNAIYSNGAIRSYSIPAESYEWLLESWVISGNDLAKTRGDYYRVTGNFPTHSHETTRFRFKIAMGPSVLWESPWSGLGSLDEYIDAGAVRLPPNVIGDGNFYPLTLNLYVQNLSDEVNYFTMDFAQLMPTNSYRRLRPSGYGTPYLSAIYDLQTTNELYVTGGEFSGRSGHYVAEGGKLELVPGVDTRVFFQMLSTTGNYWANRTASISMTYRPRYASLPPLDAP